MKQIISAQNEALKHLSKLLTQAKARREQQQAVLEGTHLLDAFLNAGGKPLQVFVPESKLEQAEVQGLLTRVERNRISVANSAALTKISSLTQAQDLMTQIALPANEMAPQTGDCVVLEQVQDPGNMGTILRSAAAAGVGQVVLSADCVDVWSPKVLRAAMGAHFLLKLSTRADLAAWRAHYRSPVWATALSDSKPHLLYELDLCGACAWIFGNEGSGISPAMQQAATGTVKIPMLGATESLNVAMAATICLFEQMRQRFPNRP